jgi:hypothetical protein
MVPFITVLRETEPHHFGGAGARAATDGVKLFTLSIPLYMSMDQNHNLCDETNLDTTTLRP